MAKPEVIAYVVRPEFGNKLSWAVSWDFTSPEGRDDVAPMHRGEAMTAEQLARIPKRLMAENVLPPNDTPPDIIGFRSGPFLISAKARELLEDLEPGVHQFTEVEVLDRVTLKFIGIRQLLHVSVRLDCIDYDATRFGRGHGEENGASSGFNPYPGTSMVVFEPAIHGHHYWRGGGRAGGVLFISAQLADLFKTTGVHGWALKYWCVPSSRESAGGSLVRH